MLLLHSRRLGQRVGQCSQCTAAEPSCGPGRTHLAQRGDAERNRRSAALLHRHLRLDEHHLTGEGDAEQQSGGKLNDVKELVFRSDTLLWLFFVKVSAGEQVLHRSRLEVSDHLIYCCYYVFMLLYSALRISCCF